MKSVQNIQVPYAKSVTMKDIAERCGVCKQTVSRAFRNDPKVSKEKTAEILEMAKELGYDISQQHAARRMALQKHGRDLLHQVIAFICSPGETPDHYISQFMWGIWEVTTSRGYALLMVDQKKEFPPTVKRGEIDGAILFDLSMFDEVAHVAARVRETMFGKRPIVTLVTPTPNCSAVMLNDREGARLAAGHLLDLGHRRIVHFHREEFSDHVSIERAEGYRIACRERGLKPDDCLIAADWFIGKNPDSIYEDYAITISRLMEMLKKQPDITAILGRQDQFTVELIRALLSEGYSVPEDFSVIGYDDNIPFIDITGSNILTSVRAPLLEMGKQAAKLALQLVAGDWDSTEKIILSPELVVRNSTMRIESEVTMTRA